jgi:hypothetical protein
MLHASVPASRPRNGVERLILRLICS